MLDNIYAADVRANLVDRWRAVAQWEADERAVLVDINFLHSQARELENRRGRVAREIVAARNSEEAAKRRRIIEVRGCLKLHKALGRRLTSPAK